MTTPAINAGQFDSLMQRITDAVSKINPTSQRLISGAEKIANVLPADIAQGLRTNLKKLQALIARLLVEIAKFTTQQGNPFKLVSTGKAWTEGVGAKASNLVSTMDANETTVDDKWTGAAASAYVKALPLQKTALTGVKEATDEIDDLLIKMAGGILAFWGAAGAAILMFVAELAVEVVTAFTPAAPAAAVAAVTSVAKVIALLGTIATAYLTYITTVVLPSAGDLRQRLNNNNPYPNGAWPKATKSNKLNDASLLDKDRKTDWHVNPDAGD